jgi:hypothetical protein
MPFFPTEIQPQPASGNLLVPELVERSSMSSLFGRRAAVVGGGIGGLSVAGALAGHFEQVDVLERDRLTAASEAGISPAGSIRLFLTHRSGGEVRQGWLVIWCFRFAEFGERLVHLCPMRETATARYIAGNISTQLMLKTFAEIISTMADDPAKYRADLKKKCSRWPIPCRSLLIAHCRF